MNIWMDIVKPSEVPLFQELYKRLSGLNWKVHVTCTNNKEIIMLLERKGICSVIVDGNEPNTIGEREITRYVERVLHLMENLEKLPTQPSVFLCVSSISGSRCAFGLGIPVICLFNENRSDKSKLIERALLPLADWVVTPNYLLKTLIEETPVDSKKIKTFNGLFEAVWMKNTVPSINSFKKIGLKKNKHVLVRLGEKETKCKHVIQDLSYFVNRTSKLVADTDIVFSPRNPCQAELLKKEFAEASEVKILEGFVGLSEIISFFDVVITFGRTLGIEAALAKTPSFILSEKEYASVKYLKRKGYPIFHFNSLLDAEDKIFSFLKGKWRVIKERKLRFKDDPFNITVKLIENLFNR